MINRDSLADGAAVGSDRIVERAPRKSMASAGFGSPGEDVTVRAHRPERSPDPPSAIDLRDARGG